MEVLGKLPPDCVTEVFSVLDKGPHGVAKGVVVPLSAGYPQDGERLREQLLICQGIERRDQGGAAQIADHTKNHHHTGGRCSADRHSGVTHLEIGLVHTRLSSSPGLRHLRWAVYRARAGAACPARYMDTIICIRVLMLCAALAQ